MKDKFKNLQQPLTKDDIEFRVGTVSQKGASLLLYKTARVDAKRLDEVFSMQWQRKHYIDHKGNVVCTVSIYDQDLKEWISREDVGTESNTEKEKGAYSDAFKRACSSWGVGRELYDAPFIFLELPTASIAEGSNKYKLTFEAEKNIKKALITEYEVENEAVKKITINVNGVNKTFTQKDISLKQNAEVIDENKPQKETIKAFLSKEHLEVLQKTGSEILKGKTEKHPYDILVDIEKAEKCKKWLSDNGYALDEKWKTWKRLEGNEKDVGIDM